MMENTIFGWRVSLNAPSDFNMNVFDTLVLREIINNSCVKYYQCKLCPFFQKMCKGIPPLRAHVMKNNDFYNMTKFIKYWNDKLIKNNHPLLIPQGPVISVKQDWTDARGVKHTAKNKADWKECVAWTKKATIALKQIDITIPIQLSSLRLKGEFTPTSTTTYAIQTMTPPPPSPHSALQTTSLPSFSYTEPKNIIKPEKPKEMTVRQSLTSELESVFRETSGKPTDITKKVWSESKEKKK